MTSHSLLTAGAAALIVAISPSGVLQAQKARSAGPGLDLARDVCAQCHAVRRAELNSPNSRAPSFESIASTSGITAMALKVALRTSHQTMPNLILSETETNDVVAYILSLGDR